MKNEKIMWPRSGAGQRHMEIRMNEKCCNPMKRSDVVQKQKSKRLQ